MEDPCILFEWTGPEAERTAALGAKADRLLALKEAGLPVPPFFTVPAWSYSRHRDAVKQQNPRAISPDAIESAILNTPVADALQVAIREGREELGAGPLAVRSSATAEDLPGQSFAGQYQTLLNVRRPDACIEAVRQCWASAWTDRARAYREQNNIPHDAVRMAVLVQQMIPAEVSGVLFTADPVTGRNDRIVIEAVFGLGEGLVGGRIAPDRYTLDKAAGTVVDRSIADKPIAIVPTENGTAETALAPDKASTPCLDDDALHRLYTLATRIEDLFHTPQDIEWALHNGRIAVLQSRPITTLAAHADADWLDHQIWTNTNAIEVLPDVVTPMTRSILAPGLRKLFANFFDRAAIELDPDLLTGTIAGRYYFNVNTVLGLFGRLVGRGGLDLFTLFGGWADEELEQAVTGLNPRYIPRPRLLLHRVPLRTCRFLSTFRRSAERRVLAEMQFVERRTEQALALHRPGMTEQQLCDAFLHLVQHTLDVARMSTVLAMTVPHSFLLVELCRRWFDDRDHALANRLLSGVGGLADARSGFALWDLAAQAAKNQQVKKIIEDQSDFKIARTELEKTESGRAFLADWDRMMQEHGHLCRGEIELANPRWSEQPDRVLAIVRSYLPALDTTNPHERLVDLTGAFEESLAQCRRRLRNPFKRRLFTAVAARARLGSRVRENIKDSLTRGVAAGRRILLDLAHRLHRRGVLQDPSDIFFLEHTELPAVLDGTIPDVPAHIAARRAEHDANAAVQPPPVVIGRYNPRIHAAPAADAMAVVLHGLGVSPGVAEGPARIILHADDDLVRPGEILVAPATDPAWTPYFVNAAAIVVDLGGLLSHGSIVAREFGKPCVVNVGPATQRIRTGQRIRVDGIAGTVTLLDEPPAPDAATLSEEPPS